MRKIVSFFFSSRRRHTRLQGDWSSDVCSSDLSMALAAALASGAPLINLSVAGPADPLLSALVQSGLKHGVTFVGAAGGADEGFPTAIPGVIAAAGSEQALPPGALGATPARSPQRRS